MSDYITEVAAPVLFILGVAYVFLILVGQVALVALVYWIRDRWAKRGR